MASLPRRQLLFAGAGLALGACRPSGGPVTVSKTPPLDMDALNRGISAIAAQLAPGVLGVSLMNLESGEPFTFNGDRRFPMQSVFKAPLAAAVLAEVDARRFALDAPITLGEMDLSPWSRIGAQWPARRRYTGRELLEAAVSRSDNTAADVLMARIGGPGAVTAWLAEKRIESVRVDRYERELQPELLGLPSFHPDWKDEAAFVQAWRSVPPARQRQALDAYLADPRDTATPRGMLDFLSRLDAGELLSPASRALLLQMMTRTDTGAGRIRAALPRGATLAHKTGTGPRVDGVLSAINDAGLVTLDDGRRYAIAIFLSGSTLTETTGDAPLAAAARVLLGGTR